MGMIVGVYFSNLVSLLVLFWSGFQSSLGWRAQDCVGLSFGLDEGVDLVLLL